MRERGFIAILTCIAVSSAALSQSQLAMNAFPRLPQDLKNLNFELVRSGCFGRCPTYSIQIAGNGMITYEGKSFVEVKGQREGHVSAIALRRLTAQFLSAGFLELRSSYGDCGGDGQRNTISIEWPGMQKTVEECGAALYLNKVPPKLIELEQAIERTSNSRQWVQPANR